MATSIYLVPTPEDGVLSFRSRTLMHKLLGIHDRFENCIAYAPDGKYAPYCSRNINRANMQRRPGLLAELLQANIPSRQAQTLLREISHCVVCGITGWHQPESKKIFKEWCQKLWLNYLRAHGLDPDLCLSSPENLSRRSWRVGLLNARIEHDAQLAILAGSEASESETESEDETDVSPNNDDDGDDDDDNGGSDDGDNADDAASDGTDSDLVILTPRSATPDCEHGDDLASTASSRALDHSPSHYQNIGARSSRVNSDHSSSASSSSSGVVSRTTQQAGPTVFPVSQSSKCAIQKLSTRLQVYRDPVPPPQPSKQRHQASAGTSGSTKTSSTTSLPTDTRRALGTLDRNIDTGSQNRESKPQPGPSRPRRGTHTREPVPIKQSGAAAAQQRAGGDSREYLSNQAETIQQRVIGSFEGVGTYDNNTRQRKRRPCSRCRGCGYRIIDDGPLATEEDVLQMLSQFDVTEEQQQEEDSASSPTKKGFRVYNPQLTPTENMKSILNTILQHSGPRNRAPGYIYAFTRPSLPGFLKIGYTNAVHNPDRPYPDPVDFRLARWASDCGHPVVEAFRAYMPCAAERMESLIHQTLREYRRVEDPGCRPCQRRRGGGSGAHDEWFEVDVEVAQRVVSSWALFSAQRPYDSFANRSRLSPHPISFSILTSNQNTTNSNHHSIMTRSHKYNDKDHAGLADGTAAPEEHLPRFFAKHGHAGEDPKKVKKSGGGKANWGNPGDEIIDDQFNFAHPRRGSNSSGYANIGDFKTKFDMNEVDPVFEESIHGPEAEDELTKTDSASTSGGSVDEIEHPAKSV